MNLHDDLYAPSSLGVRFYKTASGTESTEDVLLREEEGVQPSIMIQSDVSVSEMTTN